MMKRNGGVTLVALTITVVIILIVTGMIVYSAQDSLYVKNLTDMQNDIVNLRDKISLYYSKYGEIPASTEYPDVSNLQESGVIGANDTGKFLIIELEYLDGLSLNFGKDYEKYKSKDYTNLTDLTDLYIINKNSHNIFYVEGIKVKENNGAKIYYTDYTEGDTEAVILKEIKENTIKIGDYINYTYDTVSDGYDLPATQSGYTSNQTIAQTTGLKWRILNIHEDGTIDLISETVPDTTVYFQGALGYNNGVYLLNNICNELYSNSSLGLTARSVNLGDIESQLNETGIAARNAYNNGVITYGETKTYTGTYANYPLLYAKENGSGINTTTTKKDGITVNDEGYTSPTEETLTKVDSLTVTENHYQFSNVPEKYFKDYNGNSSTVRDLLFNTGTNYWLASRYANCISNNASFGLRYVNTSNLDGHYMIDSFSRPSSDHYYVRPVVTLGTDIEIIAVDNADGNSTENMHQINKK